MKRILLTNTIIFGESIWELFRPGCVVLEKLVDETHGRDLTKYGSKESTCSGQPDLWHVKTCRLHQTLESKVARVCDKRPRVDCGRFAHRCTILYGLFDDESDLGKITLRRRE